MMARLVYRWHWFPSAGRLKRQIWLSVSLVALAVFAFSLQFPAADTLRYGIRLALTADYDVAPVLQTFARLARPADDGAADPGAADPGAAGSAPAFVRPVPPGHVLSWFGWRVGSDGQQEYHTGVDLEAPKGEAVRAAADGMAKKVADDPSGYGRYVIIGHGDGWETLYAHNARLLVISGQRVRQGQIIARAGQTGNATVPHVHLEVHLAGSPVDPAPYLGLARD